MTRRRAATPRSTSDASNSSSASSADHLPTTRTSSPMAGSDGEASDGTVSAGRSTHTLPGNGPPSAAASKCQSPVDEGWGSDSTLNVSDDAARPSRAEPVASVAHRQTVPAAAPAAAPTAAHARRVRQTRGSARSPTAAAAHSASAHPAAAARASSPQTPLPVCTARIGRFTARTASHAPAAAHSGRGSDGRTGRSGDGARATAAEASRACGYRARRALIPRPGRSCSRASSPRCR